MANNIYQNDVIYEIDENGRRLLVRSRESTQRVYLLFTNRTTRLVNVWWRDFHGARQLYFQLPPGTCRTLNSFVTHPWEFTDAATMEHYVINNNPIFRAPKDLAGMPHRTNWNITISVRSLRTTAMLAVATRLRDTGAVNALGLPRVLAEQLQRVVARINRPTIAAQVHT